MANQNVGQLTTILGSAVNQAADLFYIWDANETGSARSKAILANQMRFAVLPAFTGNALKVLRINAAGTDLEWATVAAQGQIVSSTSSTPASTGIAIPFDNSPPQNGEGAEYLTRAITPANAGSTLKIEFEGWVANSGAGGGTAVALFVDSTAGSIFAKPTISGSANSTESASFTIYIAAGSTSARTYKIRFGPSAGTSYMLQNAVAAYFGSSALASLTITELLP